MAPSATNGDALAVLDEIKAPDGVVIPPKEIKAILEKTAGYVARNGLTFEDRIREKEKHNPKFSFLSLNDSYNAYYLWRLSEIKEGRGNAIAAGRAGEDSAETDKPKGPPEPPAFQYSAPQPIINAQDLEVVRLTALFVAKNGLQFMAELAHKESNNFQFDFLRPIHSLHKVFLLLVDQYSSLLRAGGVDGEGGKLQQERIRELDYNVRDRFRMLGKAKQRAEWVSYQNAQQQKQEEDAQNEKVSYAQIDWHDFVVVEQVLFTDADDKLVFPPPTSLSELQFASLEQKAHMSMNSHNKRIEEAFPSGEDERSSSYSPQPLPMHPPPSRSPQPAYQQQQPPPVRSELTEEEEEEEQRIWERTEARIRAQQAQAEAKGTSAPMKIKENYVPFAAAKPSSKPNAQLALCPNCNQQIPLGELDDHMRIELLDPRWKEQKAKSDSRQSSSNLWNNDAAGTLKRLASQRSDLFDGVTGQPLSEEEAARRKKASTSYDGHPETKDAAVAAARNSSTHPVQNMNVEDQIRAIHEKFGSDKGK